MKKLSFVLILVLSLLVFAVSCGGGSGTADNGTHTQCVDGNNDGKCDECGKDMTPNEPGEPDEPDLPDEPCAECKDEDGDGKCDACGNDVEISDDGCVDEDFDGKCDDCEKDMKTAIAFVENGKTNFSIVTASGAPSKVVKAVDGLVKELKSFGVTMPKLDDNASTVTEYEILIGGVTTRGEEYIYDMYSLGPNGYAVQIIGTKIIVIGGSDEGLALAVDALREDILGITDSTKKYNTRFIYASQSFEKIQDDYRVDAIQINGTDIKGYTIAVDKKHSPSNKVAKAIQATLYEYAGYWLPIVDISEADKSIAIRFVDVTGAEGFYVTVSENLIDISCEFESKFVDESIAFIDRYVKVGRGTVNFTEKHNMVKNIRDVYYKDFGAVGDGETDDYEAIKAAHEYANSEPGHKVFADHGATYYIGKGHTVAARIQTDTSWGDATFIIDDSEITPFVEGDYGATNNPERMMWIFTISASLPQYTVPKNELPARLDKNATNIGFAPGYKCVVKITNSNHKNYIRYGGNENDGAAQTEVVLVDSEGNILPGTELMWTYETVTAMRLTPADEVPITVSGGKFLQSYNNSPSEYNYYSRGIHITRSNVTLTDIKHEYLDDYDREHGAPMSGFTSVNETNNVTIQRMEFDNPKSFYTMGTGGVEVVMGSYEIAATASTNITWKDCTQLDFWTDDTETYARQGGLMGTNHCKNVKFLNMTVCSFDAHCGAQNVTIIGGHIEHINCIGAGEIYVEGTTIYTKYQNNAINLRSDYGSLWLGNATFKDVILATADDTYVVLFDTSWYNHDFGYRASMPTVVTVDNITVLSDIGLNTVRLAEGSATTSNFDIWDEEAIIPDKNGKLVKNLNPYMPTEKWIIKNNNNKVEFVLPPKFEPITQVIYE